MNSETQPALRDIRPPIEIHALLPWVLGAAALAALALLAWLWWRRHRARAAARAAAVSTAPEPTPIERARAELADARAHLHDAPDGHFSKRVSDALRRYIEAATGIRAREQTSEEFLESATRKRLVDDASAGSLRAFMELCDLAKFARQPLLLPQREQLIDHAAQFIERHHASATAAASTSAARPATTSGSAA